MKIIKAGLKLLLQTEEGNIKYYGLRQVCNKIEYLTSKSIATATLSGMKKHGKGSKKNCARVASAILTILEKECCLTYDEDSNSFEELPDCVEELVPEKAETNDPPPTVGETDNPPGPVSSVVAGPKPPITDGLISHTLHLGRMGIKEKGRLIEKATQEIYEVGTRLRQFANYFYKRPSHEYKIYVDKFLSQPGTVFKSYVLEPDSEEATTYFNDRFKAAKKDDIFPRFPSQDHATIKEVINTLLRVREHYAKRMDIQGEFEIYTYRHIPYKAIMALDPMKDSGKIIAQHYVYGIERSECPTLEMNRSSELYDKYLTSLQTIIRNAKHVTEPYPNTSS
ncbi:MAG: hypothetical protein AAFV95_10545 [Bacteroidota bacterium]